MCGISGIIFKNNFIEKEKIISMNGLISHRGPDQSGYLEFNNLLLGHVRLSVLDISDKGRQPMSNDSRYSIVFNGEVYNYKELKDILMKKKYKFYSTTDTEVVLNSYKEWGQNCFEKFNGDWVISILDKKTKTIIIARDGIGVKPCFIFEDSKHLAFCSEIKGFLALRGSLEFDQNNIGISPIALCSYSNTKFKNIRELSPGKILKINLQNLEKKNIKWNYPLENLPKIHPNYEVNQGEYYELLYNATELRLDADLKIGTSLSGGVDSSVIFTLLNMIKSKEINLKNKAIDLNPTLMNFEGNKTKEFALELAKKYNKVCAVVECPQLKDLDEIIKLISSLETTEEYFYQPILYESQKAAGVHVSIDGHGADEFLGMPNFFQYLSINNYNNIINTNNSLDNFDSKKNKEVLREIFGEMVDLNKPLNINFSNLPDKKNYFERYIPNSLFKNQNPLINEDIEILKNFSSDLSYFYYKTHCGFMQFFLNKWDHASMSSAVEVRSPFLDKNVYLYSMALPFEKKIKNGKLKSILRDSFKSLVPDQIINQNFKQGLPSRNMDINKNLNYLEEIINQESFINSSSWDSSLIRKDFKEKTNLNTIWQLCKHNLMQDGFLKRLDDVKKNYDKSFSTPPTLK